MEVRVYKGPIWLGDIIVINNAAQKVEVGTKVGNAGKGESLDKGEKGLEFDGCGGERSALFEDGFIGIMFMFRIEEENKIIKLMTNDEFTIEE